MKEELAKLSKEECQEYQDYLEEEEIKRKEIKAFIYALMITLSIAFVSVSLHLRGERETAQARLDRGHTYVIHIETNARYASYYTIPTSHTIDYYNDLLNKDGYIEIKSASGKERVYKDNIISIKQEDVKVR